MIKLLILIGLSYGPGMPVDSLGLETINGRMFVIHKVDEKETLYAISRRYRTTVDAILQYNSGAASGLEIGQILKVPYTSSGVSEPGAAARAPGDIVHEVVPKETMFSISRKYSVTIDEIRQWNKLSDNSLSIGQQLVIKKKSALSQPSAQNNEIQPRKGYHTVAAQETLFSISKQYGVTVQEIREWNNLESNELKIGQTLFVVQPEKRVVTTAEKPQSETTPDRPTVSSPPVTGNDPSDSPANPVEEKKEPQPVAQESRTQPQTIRISESYKNGSETIESGLAELIEGTEGNRKYLALHRTAPIGTILKIRNEMNNREVFVRVMGKLPDTALTNKLIIRISKSAYDRLGAIDQRFRVEVTYYK